ncbi:MCE family protein [Nocardia sp. NPDC052278]|uniref:MCE family protein n=1 Tax=unclassified Nocardia TaxID=2637762 RepID=UPI0036C85999
MRTISVAFLRKSRQGKYKKPPVLRAGVLLLAALLGVVWLCLASFRGAFHSVVRAQVVSDRSGLVMEPGSKVKLHGVPVGTVESVSLAAGRSTVNIELEPGKVTLIPSNVAAEIKPTTVFGSKYIELVVPESPARSHLSAGAAIPARNVSTEVNTVFQNLTGVMNQIEPEKLSATLAALDEGLSGRGAQLGRTLTDADALLVALNPQLPALRADLRETADAATNLGDAGVNLMTILRDASVTSDTVVARRDDLDGVLDSAAALGRSGRSIFGDSGRGIIDTLRLLTPTTALLSKYSPEFVCMLHLGAMDAENMADTVDVTNYSVRLDAGLLLGDDPYKYPENLPVVAGKGGPRGTPGCYPPVTWDTYPAPYLRIDNGAPLHGPGTDHPRPADPTIVDFMFGFTLPGGGR